MKNPEVDFLSEKDKLTKPKRKVSKLVIYLLIIFAVIIITYSIGIASSSENLSRTFGNVSLFGQIKNLIGNDEKKLQGEQEDRINILLLGMGGNGHEGPFLTDTIILASLKPSTSEVSMISIPRDLVTQIPGYGWRKVNHANAYGEIQNPGQGGELAMQVVGQTLGVPIHYYLRVDFDGFVSIVNDIGGIAINVDNKLDDPYYPIKGKETATTSERYEHLLIDVGRHYFDGEQALKFVRSRHATGIEGSDFARSERQQKVLIGVKEKTLSFSTLANPYKINKVMNTLSQHLSTNLEVWEVLSLFNLSKEIDETKTIHRVFDDSPDGLLESTVTQEGAWVLQPVAGDYSQLQNITKNIFNPEELAKQIPRRIEIQNGTKTEGLAYRTSQYLQSLGYQIIKLKNAPTQDYKKTVIYILNNEPDENDTANNIAKLLEAQTSEAMPTWVSSTSTTQVSKNTDILIILGEDRKNL